MKTPGTTVCVICLVVGLCAGSLFHSLYAYRPAPPPSVGDRAVVKGHGGSSGQPSCVWVFDGPGGNLDVLVLKEPAMQPVTESAVEGTFGRAETLSDGKVIRVFTHCVPRN